MQISVQKYFATGFVISLFPLTIYSLAVKKSNVELWISKVVRSEKFYSSYGISRFFQIYDAEV
jgi:hypothetical protein